MRNLLIIVAVAALVALAARWAVVHRQETAEAHAEQQKIASVSAAQAHRIVLTRRDHGEPNVIFEKRSGSWWIVQPEQYPASSYTVDAMIGSVGELKHERTFAASQAALDADTYGVRRAAFVIEISGDSVTRTVRLGEKNPVGELWYAQTDTDDAQTMHLVRSGLESQINKSVSDFRVREIFWQFPDDVTRMQVEYMGQVTDFTRDLSSQPASQATWYFSTSTLPATRPANKMQVDAVLNGLRNITASGFVPAQARASAGQGLTVWGSQSYARLDLIPDGSEGYLGVVAGRPYDYKIAPYSIKPLFKAARKFEPDRSNPGALNQMVLDQAGELLKDSDESGE